MTYDCFSFFNELDLLEIRLNILDPYVGFFVLGESRQTFSGKEKPLYYLENKERFAKWNRKIIHVITPNIESDSFIRAGVQKQCLVDGLKDAKDDDIVYFGDVDEIWTPQKVDDKVYNLEQLNYCYYLNNRSSERWVGTIVGKWGVVKIMSLNHWRATHTNELEDGGFHFTNLGGVEQIEKKLDAYDHQEFNNQEIKSSLKERIENGEDYVGRSRDWQGRPFDMWKDEVDLPKYILDNRDKYAAYFK